MYDFIAEMTVALSVGPTAIIKAEINGGKVKTVAVRSKLTENPILILAAYNERGQMKKAVTFETALAGLEIIDIDVDFGDASEIKAFLWNKTTMTPLSVSIVL
jgi:hypothetical protein